MSGAVGEPSRPLLRVVHGEPDAAELAALTSVVLAAARVPTAGAPAARSSAWADRAALTRRVPRPGPGAWRASGLPT